MESFLQYTKSKLDSMKVFNKVHVVLGNEACDLDSTISTLVTAFMLHSVKVESDKLVLPVLNVQRRELRLRTEVTFFLEESAISLDLVTCRDEVDLNGLYSQGKLILTLVDQNLLPVSDAHFQSCVVQIIDHHKQEWNAPDSCDLLIDPVGSCCTLVGKLMLKLAPKLVDPQIALLLYGTILLDTVCLSESAKKTTPSDIQIIEKLEAMLPDVTRDEVFTVLQKAKVDISGLTFEELLMKDLKVISENNIAVAISSLPCLLEESLKDPKTEAILQQFASRNHFSVVVILGISIEKSTNVVHRQLGVFSSNPALHKEVVNALRSSAEVDLQLSEKLVNLESVQLFEQENTSASRKVILPLLRQLLNSSQCIAQSGDPSSDLESALKSEHAPTDKQSGVDFSPPEEKFLASINTTNGGVGGPVVLFGISGEPLSSQGSSAQNSCPYTPQNSVMEEASGNDSKHTELLPSFNSRDMVEKIEEKRGRLRGYEKGSTLSSSVPFTPKNSFVESSFDVYEGHPTLDIDSMSSDDFLEKVKKKKASLSGLDEQSPFPREDVIKQSDRLSADRGNDGPDSGCVISSGEPSFDMTKSPQSPGAGDARGPMDAATLAESMNSNVVAVDNVEELATLLPKQTSSKLSPVNSEIEKDSGSEKEKKTVNHVSHPLQENWSDDRLLDPVDIDLEMATNYQAETVDFPESPQHLKLMHQKTQERERGLKSEFDEGLKKNSQSEDSSLIEDGQSNRKEARRLIPYTPLSSLQFVCDDDDDYFEDNPVTGKLGKVNGSYNCFPSLPPDSGGGSDNMESSLQLDSFLTDLPSLQFDMTFSDDDFHLSQMASSPLLNQMSDGRYSLDLSKAKDTSSLTDGFLFAERASDAAPDAVLLQKIKSCFDQDKIKDLYVLSGRLQDILSSEEIEEVLNRSDMYSEYIDDEVFEVLSYVMSERQSTSLNIGSDVSPYLRPGEPKKKTISAQRFQHTDVMDDIKIRAVFENMKKTGETKIRRQESPSRTNVQPQNIRAFFEESLAKSASTLKMITPNGSDKPFAASSHSVILDASYLGASHVQCQKNTYFFVTPQGTVENRVLNVRKDGGVPSLHHEDVVPPCGSSPPQVHKERPSALNTSGNEKRKKVISVNPDILSSDVREDDQKSLSSLSNKSDGDLASPVEDIVTPDDIITPEDLDDSLFERVGSSELIPEFSAAEEYEEERSWKTCVVGGEERKIDMKVIEPYKKVLSHGGYFGPNRHAIIVFSACYLPDRSRRDYDYVMDNLFLYVLTTLDQLVAEDYVLVYLHGATQRSNMPSFGWLKRCYQMIDRRLRKNLKGLYLVHPTFWLKTIVIMTKPFISSKFSRKLRFVSGLQELSDLIPMDHVCIPDKVKQLEFQLMINALKKKKISPAGPNRSFLMNSQHSTKQPF